MPDVLEDPIAVESSFALGGYATELHKSLLGSQRSALLQDFDLDEVVTRLSRGAFRSLFQDGSDSIAKTPNSQPVIIKTNSSNLLFQAGDTMYDVTANVPSALTPTFALNSLTHLVEANGTIYRLQASVANIFSWDKVIANAWVDLGNTNADFPRTRTAIWTSQSRMLAANGPLTTVADFDLLYYSNALIPGTWDRTVQAVYIGRGEGFGIYALIEYRQNLVLVFKSNSIWELDISNPNPSFWSTRRMIEGFGAQSQNGVTRVGSDVALLSGDGVYLLSAILAGNFIPITREVESDFNTMMNRRSYTTIPSGTTTRQRTSQVFFDGDYIWIINSQSSFALVYHVKTQRWQRITLGSSLAATKFYGLVNIAMTSTVVPRDTYTVALLGATNVADPSQFPSTFTGSSGTAYDTLADDQPTGSNVIPTQEETGGLVFGAPNNLKNGELLEVDYLVNTGGGQILIEYQLDESGTWTTLVTIDLSKKSDQTTTGTAEEYVRYTTSLNGLSQFRIIRFRFTNQASYILKWLGWTAFARVNNLDLGG